MPVAGLSDYQVDLRKEFNVCTSLRTENGAYNLSVAKMYLLIADFTCFFLLSLIVDVNYFAVFKNYFFVRVSCDFVTGNDYAD